MAGPLQLAEWQFMMLSTFAPAADSPLLLHIINDTGVVLLLHSLIT
jgi:hypothetical protein